MILTLAFKDLKAPIAFEVPKTDGDGDVQPADSIIQAHPPRRLRRLEDEQINLTQEDVERRHALAEQRRQEVFLIVLLLNRKFGTECFPSR